MHASVPGLINLCMFENVQAKMRFMALLMLLGEGERDDADCGLA